MLSGNVYFCGIMDAKKLLWKLLRPGLNILAVFFALQSFAQESNPFELTPRLDVPITEDTTAPSGTGNPFDLLPSAGSARPTRAVASRKATPKHISKEDSEATNRRLLLISIISSLLLLTILVTLFRSQLGRAYRAFLNDNLLAQLQREREGVGGLPYYFFYGFFMLNAGLFIYLASQYYGVTLHPNNWIRLSYCIGGITALFLGKHLLLNIIAFIFPIEKEIRLYNFTIIVFSIILGIFFVIANMLIAYAPEQATGHLLNGSYLIIASLYLFRILRGLFIGNRFFAFHKFHFLLYICTVEIAPVLVLTRLIMG